jgi:hypothetical protein
MSSVPSPEVRAIIAAKLAALSQLVETNPQFDRSSPAASGALFHIWDFVKRTEYMLSEVEGIRQPGYEFKHAGQIKISMLCFPFPFLLYVYIYTCITPIIFLKVKRN